MGRTSTSVNIQYNSVNCFHSNLNTPTDCACDSIFKVCEIFHSNHNTLCVLDSDQPRHLNLPSNGSDPNVTSFAVYLSIHHGSTNSHVTVSYTVVTENIGPVIN